MPNKTIFSTTRQAQDWLVQNNGLFSVFGHELAWEMASIMCQKMGQVSDKYLLGLNAVSAILAEEFGFDLNKRITRGDSKEADLIMLCGGLLKASEKDSKFVNKIERNVIALELIRESASSGKEREVH